MPCSVYVRDWLTLILSALVVKATAPTCGERQVIHRHPGRASPGASVAPRTLAE